MMEYIPGQIHESLQKEHFFLVNFDFSWINCRDKRWSEMGSISDDETDAIELSKGDVVVVRFYKSSPTSESYTYLERVIYNDGDCVEYNIESIISREFMLINKKAFIDLTKLFERDKKINSIINE